MERHFSESLTLKEEGFWAILMEVFALLSKMPENTWIRVLEKFPTILKDLEIIIQNNKVERTAYQYYLLQILKKITETKNPLAFMAERLLLNLRGLKTAEEVELQGLREIEDLFLKTLGLERKTHLFSTNRNLILDGHLDEKEACSAASLSNCAEDFSITPYLACTEVRCGGSTILIDFPRREPNLNESENPTFLGFEVRKK